MADTTAVATGAPGWIDLGSPDPAASRSFYAKLFGWTADVVPDPAAGGYAMFKAGGKEVAGVGGLMSPQQPPAWTTYVLVDDAAAIAAKAKEAGGTVIAEPFEVMHAGTMGIIASPSGAVLGIWQAGEHRGFEVKEAPGSYCWVELHSRDIPSDKAFCWSVFGWDPATSDVPGFDFYTEFKLNGTSIAGAMAIGENEPAGMPSYWLAYFAVDNADATVATHQELGGTVLMPATDMEGVGRFAILSDPQGAVFGILQGSGPN